MLKEISMTLTSEQWDIMIERMKMRNSVTIDFIDKNVSVTIRKDD